MPKIPAENPSSLAPHPPGRIAVDRAAADLRRGLPVVVRLDGKEGRAAALLVQAAETITNSSLERLATGSGAQLFLALTARRAGVLILSSGPFAGPAAKGPEEADSPRILTLPLPPGLDARNLRGLADPTSDLAAGPFAHLPVAAAEPGDGNEAAVKLIRLAHLLPAAVTTPLFLDRIEARGKSTPDIRKWAERENLLIVGAADILGYRESDAAGVSAIATAHLPLSVAENARITAYRAGDGGAEHYAILIGEAETGEPVLTRIHSACFTGDFLGSLRCDCGAQLQKALSAIADAGCGILLYLTQEGRGIGLVNKLRAYQLQDQGYDTFEANEQLGFDADERAFRVAADMLIHLGFTRVRLMTNNPAKVDALTRFGVTVTERVPHAFPSNGHNEAYLQTKARRGGHLL